MKPKPAQLACSSQLFLTDGVGDIDPTNEPHSMGAIAIGLAGHDHNL